MKLLTEEIRKRLPKLGSTVGQGENAVAQVKFFTPWGGWTWYAVEFDGWNVFYGYVIGLEREFGSFALSELEEVRGPFGLKVERDLYFKPTPLKELVKE
jgi:Protein of unknown function (DUF2958)